MALVSIKVSVGSIVLLENSYEASADVAPMNVVEPGPGEALVLDKIKNIICRIFLNEMRMNRCLRVHWKARRCCDEFIS
jgi:hypothetical protein